MLLISSQRTKNPLDTPTRADVDVAPTLDDFYDPSPIEPGKVYQGEVVAEVPVVFLPATLDRWLLLSTDKFPIDEVVAGKHTPPFLRVLDANKTDDAWRRDGGTVWVVACASKQRLLVLSHTCDIAVPTKRHIQVAPIYPVSILTDAKKKSLFAGDFKYRFCLPRYGAQIPEDSFAELSMMASVPKAYFRADRPPLRLTQAKTVDLQNVIAGFLARPFGFAPNKDSVPKTGEYLCALCFYKQASITRLSLTEGIKFPDCPHCSDRALWVYFAGTNRDIR